MKRFFSLLAISVALLTFPGCVNTEQFTNDIADLQRRVTALEDLCKQMNKDIESVQGIASAAQNGNYITSVTPISYGGETIGYTIAFVKGNPITIYNGKNGTDGHTPQIGVREDADGIWYWTVEGAWLLDPNGGKVKAVGKDGKDGEDGDDGTDGITPQLKIENGYWYVSMDNGATWTQYGKATGEDGASGDSFFKSVTQDENNVFFTLSDDTTITIPKSSILEISFDPDGEVSLQLGVKKDITYTVTSSLKPVTVRVVTSSDIKAKVTPADQDGLTGTISLEAISMIDEYSHIEVMIDNGARMTMANLTPVSDTHKWIDLGLPSGLKWATCNVGASNPEEYGDYFAWGETEPYYTEGHSQDNPCSAWKSGKAGYNWASYKFVLGTDGPFFKYVTDSSLGTVDNKTELDPEDDAAGVNWGGNWRMPTNADWTELIDNCTWTWTAQNGVNGRLVTGPNGNSIFLPAAGGRDDTYLRGTGSYGDYWSSSLNTDQSSETFNAWNVYFLSGNVLRNYVVRYAGLSVRPVTE